MNADQAAIDNAQATLGYAKIIAPLSGRTGLRQVDQGNIIHAADTTGLVIITQLQPIAVQFSLPQQQIVRVNAASAKGPLAVDVFGNDGVTVVDTGKLAGIDNQVDPTTGTLKLKAEFPNANLQLWPGQFVNIRLKVDTLLKAVVVPTSAVQRGPIGTFSYVIGDGDVVSAKPVVVTQQNENDAVIASGLVDLRSRGHDRLCQSRRWLESDCRQGRQRADRRSGAPQKAQQQGCARQGRSGKDGQQRRQGKDGERRGKRGERGEGDPKGQTGPAQGEPSGGAAKSSP